MKGRALAYGAVSVVNAIPTGRGSAFGIDLKTEAEVKLSDGKGEIEVCIAGEPTEDTSLAREVVSTILGKETTKVIRAVVQVSSEIPIGRGLKSSSSASNAIAMATIAAIGIEMDELATVNIGVDASLKTGVSVTGAFDDACACFFGGIVVTDNYTRKIWRQEPVENLIVLIHVPEEKIHTRTVDRNKLKSLGPLAEEAFNLSAKGEYWKAMSLNGQIIATSLGQSTQPSLNALAAGALAAGLSGTGPATAAVCLEDSVESVCSSWSNLPGRIIKSKTSNRKAEVIK